MRAVLFLLVCASITVYAEQIDRRHPVAFEPLATLLFGLNPAAVTQNVPRKRSRPTMMASEVGAIYGDVLYTLGADAKRLDEMRSNLNNIRNVYDSSAGADLKAFISNPMIDKDKKKALLKSVFQTFEPLDLVSKTLNLLVDRERIEELPDVINAFEDTYRKEQGIVICKVTSAVALTEEQISQIKEKVKKASPEAKTVWLATKVDPNIIGGFIIDIEGGATLDGSTRRRLNALKAALLPKGYEPPQEWAAVGEKHLKQFKEEISSMTKEELLKTDGGIKHTLLEISSMPEEEILKMLKQ